MITSQENSLVAQLRRGHETAWDDGAWLCQATGRICSRCLFITRSMKLKLIKYSLTTEEFEELPIFLLYHGIKDPVELLSIDTETLSQKKGWNAIVASGVGKIKAFPHS